MWKIALVGIILLCNPLAYGQGETSNWYFGNNAGIRFNNDGSVTPLNNGQLNTFEGCAAISNASGGLLFYTDGITVYDKTHNIMENGTELYGDSSSTQSAIIVPAPGSADMFYIFTVDTKVLPSDSDNGLNYSVVDMSMNEGNGAVVQKNVNLLPDCSEKITAVIKDCSEQSFWILTLASSDGSPGLLNTYHAYELNTTGLVTTSVKSTFTDLAIQDPRGYLKLSPDGTKVASANAASGLYLYDFDASTGIVSNQLEIEISGVNKAAYGIEFSPNGELLYVHASNDLQAQTGHSSSLYQYDLTATDIGDSEFLIDIRNNYRAALQLGANGKIYKTVAVNYNEGAPYLSAINNPNGRGERAGYKHLAVSLGDQNSTQGLPPFVQSFFNKTAIIRNVDGSTSNSLDICEGESFLLETDDIPGAIYDWKKDGMPLDISTNVYQLDDVSAEDSGRFTVTVTPPDPAECPIIGEAFINVTPVPIAGNLSLIQCDIDPGASEDGISMFNLSESIENTTLEYQFYESLADRDSNNPIQEFNRYTNTTPFNQTIYYKATSEFGCHDFGELELEVRPNPLEVQSGLTLYGCDENLGNDDLSRSFDLGVFSQQQYPGIDVTFYSEPQDATLKINALPGIYNTQSTEIYARLEIGNECLGVDKIDLEILPRPLFEIDTEYTLCIDNPQLDLEGPPGFDFYRWELIDGGNSSIVSESIKVKIKEVGNYRLFVGYNYSFPTETIRCEQSMEFHVLPSNLARIEEVIIEDFTNSNTVQVMANGNGNYEYSIDGISYQDTDIFRDVAPGFYTLYVRDLNGCGISTKEISVLGYPKFFTPNGDGINDIWRVTGIDEQFQPDANITIYDRYGILLAQFSPLDNGWNGMLKSNPLPASDYWFRLTFSDGREITGHFALKR